MSLLGLDLDRVPHLADIKLVRIKRLGAEPLDFTRSRGGGAARHPAGDAADDESRNRGRSRHRAPGAPAFHDPLRRQPVRHRLVDDRAVAGPDRLGLGAPSGNAGGVFGVAGEPRLDGLPAIRRQFAVDIDVQLVFRHLRVVVDHRMTFLLI
jgi:hypothetical protein